MSHRFELEDFAATIVARAGAAPVSDPVVTEESRLNAYEEGYGAGWSDAVKSDQDAQKKISQDFAQNLADLSFTYHEARGHLIAATEPVFRDLIEKVFPTLVSSGLCVQVLETIKAEIDKIGSAPVELVTAPENAGNLRDLVGQNSPIPIEVIEEVSLTSGQVYLRFGQEERRIDLAEVQDGMEAAISAFFHNLKNEVNYGT